MSNTCGCQNSGNADFAELAPVLEKYAKVPGSLITILQQTQDIYGYLSMDANQLYRKKNRDHDLLKFTVWLHSMHSSVYSRSESI